MNVLFVASELAPFAKTGGLADVMAALPKYLKHAGHDVRIVVPLYDTIDRTKLVLERAAAFEIPLGPHRYAVEILRANEVYFVHCPALYARGRLYTSDPDEHPGFSHSRTPRCSRAERSAGHPTSSTRMTGRQRCCP